MYPAQDYLTVLYHGKSILKRTVTLSETLHLAARKDDPCLERLLDRVVMPSFTVCRYLFDHCYKRLSETAGNHKGRCEPLLSRFVISVSCKNRITGVVTPYPVRMTKLQRHLIKLCETVPIACFHTRLFYRGDLFPAR